MQEPNADLRIPSAPQISPSKGPDVTLWTQVEALRELLQEGSILLGDVLEFTRSASLALTTVEEERQRLDLEAAAMRTALAEARQRILELEQTLLEQEHSSQKAGDPTRVHSLEEELRLTRILLLGERRRRDRAMELIRPSAGGGES